MVEAPSDEVLVIHQHPSVVGAVTRAFAGTELSASVVQTLDQALDYICRGGTARIVFYDGDRPEVACAIVGMKTVQQVEENLN